ncbi:Ig domain-containing protein [Salinisphaera shabanensis T35B1]|jgi:hypothetical protein|uniref:Invasin domain protein n=1 Tax=Salinisphaera shabanensis E1L3A TaxID=1033802 RepID=U2FN45_9GAMM|nr:Ig-like domain-containing protein [Salinisphaera shabanensis]ERJ17629.1 Invasin domain protein [Salinisphaera shabanensis E1L3A]
MPGKTIYQLLTITVLATALGACGGSTSGGDDDNGGGSSGGGSGGGTNNPSTPDSNTQIGSIDSNGQFQEGRIGVTDTTLQAGQSSSLTVRLRSPNGSSLGDTVQVFFSSPCSSTGQADIAPAVAESQGGIATTTYTALGCVGTDTVTARTSVEDTTLTATADIETEAAQFGAIEFDSVSQPLIGLRGTGALPEQSTVTFRVTNSTGSPLPNQTVNFSLNTTVGGLSLSNTSTSTDNQGVATTTVTSGTVATSVRVTASTTSASGQQQSAQSSELAVTTGLPDNDSFSLSATTLNVEGQEFDGVTSEITIRAADRFNNPVPDNTAITFRTEGGSIPGSCTTQGGACTVTFTTQSPRPADGRATILATAIGEESFSDTAPSNGRFDEGEFDIANDLPEAFVDYDEDGVRDSNEPYIDFNNNSSYDLGDGEFTGLRCQQSTSAADELACDTDSINVRDQVVIVFSASTQIIQFDPSTINLDNGNVVVNVEITGQNGQIPPAETGISASTTLGSIVGPSSYTVRSTSARGPYVVSFEIEPEDNISSSQTGRLNITVTTPRDVISRDFAPISQNP